MAYKIFEGKNLASALENCENSNYKALFVPEIVELSLRCGRGFKIASRNLYSEKPSLEGHIRLFDEFGELNISTCTPSMRIVGTTKTGNKVVAFTHIPNYCSNPSNMKKNMKNNLRGDIKMPKREFYNILDLDGISSSNYAIKLVSILDADVFEKDNIFRKCILQRAKDYRSGYEEIPAPIGLALNDPVYAAFFGNEYLANSYLLRYRDYVMDGISPAFDNLEIRRDLNLGDISQFAIARPLCLNDYGMVGLGPSNNIGASFLSFPSHVIGEYQLVWALRYSESA